GQDVLGFGTAADGAWQFARFKDPALIAEVAREHTPAWRSLAVSVLHKVVLEKLIPEAGLSQPKCAYVHSLKEVNDGLRSRACQVAVLVPPARMAHVEQIAGNLEKMPPKSTYFYPKLLSGLVLHSLKG